jgi:hypothetical protein
MGLANETIDAVYSALVSVYGFTNIERRSSLELINVKRVPYATLVVTNVTYGNITLGESDSTCEVSGGVLFKSESDLLNAMDRIEEFRSAISDYTEVIAISFDRLHNSTDAKQFNYAMAFVVTTQGDWN